MLNSMDSMEYTHWMAYERAYGPLTGEWDAEATASGLEQLQTIAYLLGQAHFTDRNRPKGPIPKPEHYPRPHESLPPPTSVVDDIGDEEEWLPPTEDELVDIQIDPADTEEEKERRR